MIFMPPYPAYRADLTHPVQQYRLGQLAVENSRPHQYWVYARQGDRFGWLRVRFKGTSVIWCSITGLLC